MARESIDRADTSPFLLTLWISPNGTHQPASAYRNPSSHTSTQVQLYTWLDASLKEVVISFLSSRSGTHSFGPSSRVSLRHAFWDPDVETFVTKDLAQIQHRDLLRPNAEIRGPALKTLDDFGFIAGDYLDIAFTSHQPPAPASTNGGLMRDARSGAAMGPRGMKSDGGWGRPPARDAGFNIRGAGGRDRDDGWSRADAADRW